MLTSMFMDMPYSIRSAFDAGLRAIEKIILGGKLAEFTAMRRLEVPVAAGPYSIERLKETMTWDTSTGYWIMDVDPQTMSRTRLEVSSGIATFMNVHPDEMLARVGNCDNPIPQSQLEFFGSITYEIAFMQSSKLVRNLRLVRRCPKSGKLLDPMLCRLTTIRERDSFGRMVRVMNILQRLTPSDYDQELMTKPTTCRPLLWVIGDQRNGDDLLQSANYDYLFSQSFRGMKETMEGQRSLLRLQREVSQIFKPFVDFAALQT
mmetsp:Transcript_15870/g.53082  ORF Transcript_15870/g.53082 Transcript_15870/m.53082 type:complete len:262 (-) Transcript_15870:99-884(-)